MTPRPEGVAALSTPTLQARTRAVERAVRRTPIRWRILAIAVLNSAVALILLALIWNGARVLGDAWSDLRQVRQSERFLAALDSDAERLQSLIHRYFAQTDPDVLARIIDLRDMLMSRMRVQARLDPLVASPARDLTVITERLVGGFDELRETRSTISLTYDLKVLRPSRELSNLFAVLTNATLDPSSLIWPALGSSREAYNAMILSANAFYLSASPAAADAARADAEAIKASLDTILDLATEDDQRSAVARIRQRVEVVEAGIAQLREQFTTQMRLLRDTIDASAEAMSAAIDRMTGSIRDLERSAQARFDRTLEDVAVRLGILALAFVVLVVLIGIAIAKSISEPLGDLQAAMLAISSGDYDRPVAGLTAADEIGDMARAVDVFRENAIAKGRAEAEVRSAKEQAETSLAELREMQASLIEAEKLAALGGLVAGVAHEVNNPVGISLTVASSLQQRSELFAAELAAGPLRRSRLDAFTAGVRTASTQLVANLQRAGELVQSFKQVAVDRSHADRRRFDLGQAADQILASLRPMLKTAPVRPQPVGLQPVSVQPISLHVDIPDGIVMESFPGPFGQVLTNLFLNALHHAFDARGGTISVVARRREPDSVEILFRDDGAGMANDVQRRAFDPFFTTRRGEGGTGLGLHIVYNLVTRRLNGRIALSSAPGLGTTFRLVLPLIVHDEPGGHPFSEQEADYVPS